ncbi:MAG: ribosome silencing factor [Clostridia bacterium]|nr:ribosome silencing factor [Clostridia bacterium]
MTSEELSKIIITILDRKKASDITCIGITDLTIIADRFIIATATSSTHLNSLGDELEYEIKTQHGIMPRGIEGKATGWLVVDYGDVIVHLFTADVREHYNIERLWADGQQIDISSYITEN